MHYRSQNLGTLDRTVRLFVGPALLVVGVAVLLNVVQFTLVTVVSVLALGVFLTATGLVQRCPLYRLVGLDTRLVTHRPG